MKKIAIAALVCFGFIPPVVFGSPCESVDVSGYSMDKLIDSGCFVEAERRALKLLESASTPVEKAVLYNDLGVVHDKMARYDQAREDYARALLLFGADPKAVGLRINLAAIFYRKGEYQSARTAYQEALAALDKQGGRDSELQSAALGGLGLVLQTIGDYAAAKPHLQRALQLDIRLFGNRDPVVALDLSNLGDVHRSLGEYDQALPIFEQALAVRRAALGDNHPDVATSLGKLGYVLEIFGQTERALVLYREALRIREKSLPAGHPHTAVAMFSVADALRRLDLNGEALNAYLGALEMSEKALPAKHPDIGRVLHYLGQLQFSMGQAAQAKVSLQRAVDIRSESLGPSHALTAESMGMLGSYHAQSHDILERKKGERLMVAAFAIALAGGEPGVIVDVSGALAGYHAAQANRGLSIFYGKQSVNTMQRIRTQSRSLDKGLQKSLLGKNEGIYKQLSGWLIDSGRIVEAQQVLAMLKEDEYFDFIQRSSQESGLDQRSSYSGLEAPWITRFQKIGGQLALLGKELGELRKKSEKSPLSTEEKARLAALKKDIKVANLAFDSVMTGMLSGLKDDVARDDTLKKIDETGSRKELLGKLGHNTLLLQYLPLRDKVSIIVTTPNIRIARFAEVDEKTLNQKITAYRETLKTPNLDPALQAKELYDLLVKPVENDLRQAGAKQLMLSLNGALRYLPFAALHDGRRYLVESYALSLYNEVAADKMEAANASEWKVWGLGVTQAHEGFKALSSVKGELAGIVGKGGIAGKALLDEHFTEQAIEEGVEQRYPVIHIASHFKFTSGTMSDSYLLLGDGGHLTLQEVRATLEFEGVDLITLSACETAVGGGRDGNGVEVEGMGTIMQKKGAKSVMATLWPVEDASTAQLMRGFYHVRQKQRLNKAEALRQAQLGLLRGGQPEDAAATAQRSLRFIPAEGQSLVSGTSFQKDPQAPFAHPYFWAPFILMGNWL